MTRLVIALFVLAIAAQLTAGVLQLRESDAPFVGDVP